MLMFGLKPDWTSLSLDLTISDSLLFSIIVNVLYTILSSVTGLQLEHIQTLIRDLFIIIVKIIIIDVVIVNPVLLRLWINKKELKRVLTTDHILVGPIGIYPVMFKSFKNKLQLYFTTYYQKYNNSHFTLCP